jgi:hypothetical protein
MKRRSASNAGHQPGTLVKYPSCRGGDYGNGFRNCGYCGIKFTKMGLPRHWNHCPKRPVVREADPSVTMPAPQPVYEPAD